MGIRGFFCRRQNRARKFSVDGRGNWHSFADDPGAAEISRADLLKKLQGYGPPEKWSDEAIMAVVDALDQTAGGGVAPTFPAGSPAMSDVNDISIREDSRRPTASASRNFAEPEMTPCRRRELLSKCASGKRLLKKEDAIAQQSGAQYFAEALRDALARR